MIQSDLKKYITRCSYIYIQLYKFKMKMNIARIMLVYVFQL